MSTPDSSTIRAKVASYAVIMVSGFPDPLLAITMGTVMRGRDNASDTKSGYRLDCIS